MAPVKFDDIAKVANEVLNDDYQTSGVQLKAKQKTSWGGAVLTTAVDLFPPKDSTATPAKLTWKLPAPFGLKGVSIDKLEVDKSGKFKLEASTDKAYPDLKLEAKHDLSFDLSKTVASATYTGVKDTQVKVESKVASPQDLTLEVTRAQGCATLGLKVQAANLTTPDLGVRFGHGPYFASLLSKDRLSAFTASAAYTLPVQKPAKVAASYTHGGKQSGNASLGVVYECCKTTKVKAKVQQDQSLSLSVKHELSKGFTLLGGGKYSLAKGDFSYGFQLSIE